jgi:drug/metabolite transporter (DMT)-like permease
MGKIILKWRLNQFGSLPETLIGKITFMGSALLDVYIIYGLISVFVASIFWMVAITKFKITVAYPFMSLAPALVFLIGVFFLGEAFTRGKVRSLLLIIVGTIITVKFYLWTNWLS